MLRATIARVEKRAGATSKLRATFRQDAAPAFGVGRSRDRFCEIIISVSGVCVGDSSRASVDAAGSPPRPRDGPARRSSIEWEMCKDEVVQVLFVRELLLGQELLLCPRRVGGRRDAGPAVHEDVPSHAQGRALR